MSVHGTAFLLPMLSIEQVSQNYNKLYLQNLLWIPRKSQNALPASLPSSTCDSARKQLLLHSHVLLAKGQKNAIKAEETNANL